MPDEPAYERGESGYANSNRSVSTFELFEMYWVKGYGPTSISRAVGYSAPSGANMALDDRGIPTRNLEDAKRLENGEVQVYDLWEDYLTDFQISLAQEIRTLNHVELGGFSE